VNFQTQRLDMVEIIAGGRYLLHNVRTGKNPLELWDLGVPGGVEQHTPNLVASYPFHSEAEYPNMRFCDICTASGGPIKVLIVAGAGHLSFT
jgi:hypothetical protein